MRKWVNLTKTDIKDLEKLDETLLKNLIDAPSMTPIPGLYLDLGVYPIGYHIIVKRLMFLQHILKCDDERLISQVFWAQERGPDKNDWCCKSRKTLKHLD